MPYILPDARKVFPITSPDMGDFKGCVYLKNAIGDHPCWQIGDYTYASDFDPPEPDGWSARLAPYLFPNSTEKIILGKFCQIAHGVRLITASANHRFSGPSSYPFPVFDAQMRKTYRVDERDTVIGNDVWFGYGAIICPGAEIGNGVIVGAGSVVRGKIPDYTIVTGNPALVVKQRFSDADIARMNALAWWDWPIEAISAAAHALEHGDIDTLEKRAP